MYDNSLNVRFDDVDLDRVLDDVVKKSYEVEDEDYSEEDFDQYEGLIDLPEVDDEDEVNEDFEFVSLELLKEIEMIESQEMEQELVEANVN